MIVAKCEHDGGGWCRYEDGDGGGGRDGGGDGDGDAIICNMASA